MSERGKLLYTRRMPMRWSDMDANRHVNNAVYFTYCEQARIDWLENLRAQDTAEGEGSVVVQASLNFYKPMGWPQEFEVRIYAGRVGRTSFTTHYAIVAADDPARVFADGQAVMVWVHRATDQPRPVLPMLRELMTSPG